MLRMPLTTNKRDKNACARIRIMVVSLRMLTPILGISLDSMSSLTKTDVFSSRNQLGRDNNSYSQTLGKSFGAFNMTRKNFVWYNVLTRHGTNVNQENRAFVAHLNECSRAFGCLRVEQDAPFHIESNWPAESA
jgi:uncharacterized membrane protein YccC